MSAYAEHRARRMWAAQDYEGWELPPYPVADELGRSVCIGRVVLFPEPVSRKGVIPPGLHPFDPLIEAHYKAKEKRQNREKFDR